MKLLTKSLDQGMGVVPWSTFWSVLCKWLQEGSDTDVKPVVVDEAEIEGKAREAFNEADAIGGGFIQPEQVPVVLRGMGAGAYVELPPTAADNQKEEQRKSREDLERKVRAKAMDGIIFFEALWEVAGPVVVGDKVKSAEAAEEARAKAAREAQRIEKEKKEEEAAIQASLAEDAWGKGPQTPAATAGTSAASSAPAPVPSSSSSSSSASGGVALDPDLLQRLQAAIAGGAVPGVSDIAQKAEAQVKQQQLQAAKSGSLQVVVDGKVLGSGGLPLDGGAG